MGIVPFLVEFLARIVVLQHVRNQEHSCIVCVT
jgi:hypothetical protein